MLPLPETAANPPRDAAIVINQQSLTKDSRESWREFKDNVTAAATSRSEAQRRDALARLTQRCASQPPDAGEAMQLLDALPPLMSDRDAGVRAQLLKLLRTLPAERVVQQGRYRGVGGGGSGSGSGGGVGGVGGVGGGGSGGGGIERLAGFVRAAMTDMSSAVRADAVAFLDWLLDARANLLLACPGGWPRTLRTFVVMLGWSGYFAGGVDSKAGPATADEKGWTSAPRTTFGADRSGVAYVRQIGSLARFVAAGLKTTTTTGDPGSGVGDRQHPGFSFYDHLWGMPAGPFPYAHLQLHLQDEYNRQYLDEDMRRDFFRRHMMDGMLKAVEDARREGGAAGRAASVLAKAIRDGIAGDPGENVDANEGTG